MPPLRPILLLALLMAAAGTARAEAVLRIGAASEPETIDPARSTGLLEGKIEAELFEGLLSRDAAGRPVAGAAQSWDISDDGLVYRFHLRPDLKYSNGEPVVAGDFVYSLRRLVDPATGSENGLEVAAIVNATEIEAGKIADLAQMGVAAPDDRTVVITLRRPSIRLIDYAIDYVPLRRADIDRYGADWTRPEHLVGNGAFTLAEWVPQSHITLKRNPFYREAATVKLDRVSYVQTGTPETAFKMFRAGELDVAELPKPEVEWAKRNLGDVLKTEPEVGCYMVGLNAGAPPFDDARLRRALALVVDQDAITRKIVRGDQVPAHRFIPPVIEGYPALAEDFAGKPMAERIAEAKTLYAEAGYGPGKPLKLDLMIVKGRDWDNWSLAIANAWHAALGVEARLDTQEWQVYLGRLNHHDFTAAVDDWVTLNLAPSLLDEYRSTTASNEIQFKSADYDRAVTEADTARDVATEYAAYAAAEKLLIDSHAIIPIYHPVQHMLVAGGVRGWVANPADSHRSRFVSLAEQAAATP